MPASKSWRVAVIQTHLTDPQPWIAIAKLRAYDKSGAEIAISSAVANSSWNSSYYADKVLDGSLDTYTLSYMSYETFYFLQFNFATPVDVGSIRMSSAMDSMSAHAPTAFYLLYATPLGVLIPLSMHVCASWSAGESRTFTVPELAMTAQHWGVLFPQRSVTLGELALRMSPLSNNMIVSNMLSSTRVNSATPIGNLADGNVGTGCSSDSVSLGTFVSCNLGVSANPTVFEFTSPSYATTALPQWCLIFSSSNGSDYAFIGRYSLPNPWPVSTSVQVDFNTPITYYAGAISPMWSEYNVPDLSHQVAQPCAQYDIYRHGRGVIAGVVTINGQPASRVVGLYDIEMQTIIRSTLSDSATGSYTFSHIDSTREYLVISRDHQHIYNAVVADLVTPEPM